MRIRHMLTMRVVTAMQNTHYVLHAPRRYRRSIIHYDERKNSGPPVTYTTFKLEI